MRKLTPYDIILAPVSDSKPRGSGGEIPSERALSTMARAILRESRSSPNS